MTIYHVSVTQEHIDDGIPSDCSACPVAKAICGAVDFTFGWVDVYPFIDKYYMLFMSAVFDKFAIIPSIAEEFIVKFDNDEEVEPFEFDIDIVEHNEAVKRGIFDV